jgi:hypothetical protein
MSLASKITGFLGGIFSLFPLGGSNGGTIVRKQGGTPGTQEVQIIHDGTDINFLNQVTTGNLNFGRGSATSLGYLTGSGWSVGPSGQYTWTGSGGAGATRDAGLARLAASVIQPTNASSTGGWLQNSAGRARLSSAVTNATATMANLSGLSITLIAGRKYFGELMLFANNSAGTTEGLQIDFNGGTATMTSFEAGLAGAPVGATITTSTTTALATALSMSAVSTNDQVYVVKFSLVCNAAGAFIPRVAEVSHTTGTVTVQLGSCIFVEDCP